MTEILKQGGRGVAIAAAVFATAALTAPRPAHAIDAGTAVGIGLGAAMLGAAAGAAAQNPYYSQPYYNPYYAPAPSYYAPTPSYYAPASHNCWDAYRQQYYAC